MEDIDLFALFCLNVLFCLGERKMMSNDEAKAPEMAFASWFTGHSGGRLYLYRRGRLYLLPSSSVKASCSKITPVRLVLKWLSVSERTVQRAFQSRSTSPAGKAPLYLKPVEWYYDKSNIWPWNDNKKLIWKGEHENVKKTKSLNLSPPRQGKPLSI